jgi:hypothetical protein
MVRTFEGTLDVKTPPSWTIRGVLNPIVTEELR